MWESMSAKREGSSSNRANKDKLEKDLDELERQIEEELLSLNTPIESKFSSYSTASIKPFETTKPITTDRHFTGLVSDHNNQKHHYGHKFIEPSNYQKEKNKNLFTIEDLQNDMKNTKKGKKSARPEENVHRKKIDSKQNQYQSNLAKKNVHQNKYDDKNQKENINPQTQFQSSKSTAAMSSVNSKSSGLSQFQSRSQYESQLNSQTSRENIEKLKFISQEKFRLQKESSQRLSTPLTIRNENGQKQTKYDGSLSPIQKQTHRIHENIFQVLDQQSWSPQRVGTEENPFSNRGEYHARSQNDNQFITNGGFSHVSISQSTSIQNRSRDVSPIRTPTTKGYNNNQSPNLQRNMQRSSSSQAIGQNLQKRSTSPISVLSEEYTFKPLLSRKSMEMAQKMEDPRVRLTASKQKKEEKIKKLRDDLESQFSYRPTINKIQTPGFSTSVFDISHDDEEELGEQNHQVSPISQGQKPQVVPRWQKLYDRHQATQQERELKTIQREREEGQNPELTFQPRLIKSKETEYMYTDREFDISKRSEIWAQKRQEKINKVASQYENKDIDGCTFKPDTTESLKGITLAKHASIDKISEFNKKGIVEYFERVDAAKKKKQAAEQAAQVQDISNWKHKVTEPVEFSFMQRQSKEKSPNRVDYSRSELDKNTIGKNRSHSTFNSKNENENNQANWQQKLQFTLHQQLHRY